MERRLSSFHRYRSHDERFGWSLWFLVAPIAGDLADRSRIAHLRIARRLGTCQKEATDLRAGNRSSLETSFLAGIDRRHGQRWLSAMLA